MKWRENQLNWGGGKYPKVFSIDLHDHSDNLAESYTYLKNDQIGKMVDQLFTDSLFWFV